MAFGIRLGVIISISLLTVVPVHADGIHPRGIRLDGTIGDSGRLDLEGPDYEIRAAYGRQAGTNLFHSFKRFNIHSDERAAFSGPGDIENIISRVTGGEASWIDGLLRSDIPSADLYLINPAGMMFGPNASLDLGGSFHVSTADYLRMGEKERFYSLPQAGEVLSVAAPSAFGFLDSDIAGISLAGEGWIEDREWEKDSTGLSVPEGETLAFVGGDIAMKDGAIFRLDEGSGIVGGDIVAPGGGIHLASAASAGEVVWTDVGLDLSSEKKGNITISDHITLRTDGEGGGDIYIEGGKIVVEDSYIQSKTLGSRDGGDIVIQGDDVSLLQGAKVVANTHGEGKGGSIVIREAETVTVAGISQIAKVGAPESLYNRENFDNGTDSETMSSIIARSGERDWVIKGDLNAGHLGDAGAITIDAKYIVLKDGALLSASVYGDGQGGNIELRASESITGTGEGGAYGATMVYVGTYGTSENAADAGTLLLEAPGISFSGGAGLSSTSHGKGDGGQIILKADTVSFEGKTSEEMGVGGSRILTSTDYAENNGGNGGNLLIEADVISFSGGAFIKAATEGSGNGGILELNAKKIAFTNDAVIDSGTFGTGNGGNVTLNADSVVFEGEAGIFMDTFISGNGGSLQVAAGDINFKNGAYIDSSNLGSGEGGFVDLKARESIIFAEGGKIKMDSEKENQNNDAPNIGGAPSGSVGDLSIETKKLSFSNAAITASTSGKGEGGDIRIKAASASFDQSNIILTTNYEDEGAGNAGYLQIDADAIAFTGGAAIESTTYGAGDGGKVTLNADSVVFDEEASIATDTWVSGKGGSLEISAGDIIFKNNASIYSATLGNGGGGFLNLKARESITFSDGAIIYMNSEGENPYIGAPDLPGTPSGAVGNLSIETNQLSFRDADIMASTYSKGEGGYIKIKADSVSFRDADILASTYSKGEGGYIEIKADSVSFDGGIIESATYFEDEGAGNAGYIQIDADAIAFTGVAAIESTTYGAGDGGKVTLNADSVVFDEEAGISTDTWVSGKGGSLEISAGDIIFKNNASIYSATLGNGEGGFLNLKARESITFSDGAIIYMNSEGENPYIGAPALPGTPSGSVGDLSIETKQLSFSDAEIRAAAYAKGEGGHIQIKADSVSFDGGGIESTTYFEDEGAGNAGRLQIDAGAIAFTGGAYIDSATFGTGDGGDVTLIGDSVTFTDAARIYGDTQGSGQGGDLLIEANTISFTGGAYIDSAAKDTGIGGKVALDAVDGITIDGAGGGAETSSISAGSEGTMADAGTGGAVSISTHTLSLLNRAAVTTSSKGTGDAGAIDISAGCLIVDNASSISSGSNYTPSGGDAGTISIVASDCGVAITDGSSVTTDAQSAGGGMISVLSENRIYLLDGKISSSVKQGQGNGGDIQTEAPFVILNNGSIRANAEEGDGGAIFILADYFIKSAGSVLSATSARGNDGTVNIAAPELDVSQGLTTLTAEYLDATDWMETPCEARSGADAMSLFITGKQAAPASPLDLRDFVFIP